MIVSEEVAQWAADEFINYFSHFTNIEDYLRFVKKEVISSSSSLVSLEDEFFNEDIHPQDMEFDIKFVGNRFQGGVPQEHYVNLLRAVSSHNNESNIPGRELRWMILRKIQRRYWDSFVLDLLPSIPNQGIFGWDINLICLSLIGTLLWDL